MTELNADAGTDTMSEALKDAASDLEVLGNQNLALQAEFETEGWAGLDVLAAAQTRLNSVRDGLINVADLIGVGGQIVRDAHLSNNMIGHASKASLGHS